MRRPNSVRYRRRQAKIRGGSLILLILTVLTAVLFAVGFRTLRPALAAYAENLIQYRVTIAMEQAVADAVSAHGAELSSLSSLSDGSAAALTTDSAAAERVRASAVRNTYERLNELEQEEMSVPIGTLIDPQYLAGVGPSLSFGVVGLGMASGKMQSEFVDSGVNQTKYRMVLTVRAEVKLHALWCSRSIVIENSYPLAETVLVGDVPAVYVPHGGESD
ncbi:MAG: sporulation protein YunB [Butyricicoccus sp.]|jgi:sporulation protein YunB|nr:sporulation protein YunB [Clostridiales bacterium]